MSPRTKAEQMTPLDPDHINDLRQHSIASWPRVFLAAGFAFVVTFTSSILLGASFFWNAVTGVGILFSVIATIYAILAVVLTTYYESTARNNYANSLFARSSLPLSMFIMKEALKTGHSTPTK